MNKTKTSDLNYELDKNNIAQIRYKKPKNSKILSAEYKKIIKFKNLISIIPEKTVLVLNKSKVRNVRIKTFKSLTKGQVEIFILNKVSSNVCECLIKFNGSKKVGESIHTELFNFIILDKNDACFTIETSIEIDYIINNFGTTPLPPYIEDLPSKYNDYISDFSKGGFSVAASTAGLHFDNDMLNKLKKSGILIKFINLDIGLGTFKPINTEYIDDYVIHCENYSMVKKEYEDLIDLKNKGYSVVAVGTTVLRVLETIATTGKYDGTTSLFIKPGFNFKIANYLITNFHAPKSTLLSIVLTIYGNRWKDFYAYAQSKKLKFLSFGDAVLFKIV